MNENVVLIIPPAIAGGRLKYFTSAISTLAKCGQRLRIRIAPDLLDADDLKIYLLNNKGGLVSGSLPPQAADHAWKMTPEDHNSLMEFVLDNSVEKEACEEIAEHFLPQVGETLTQAAVRFWGANFSLADLKPEHGPALDSINPFATKVTWIGPRQQHLLASFGIPAQLVLDGESKVREFLEANESESALELVQRSIPNLINASSDLGLELKRKEPKLYSLWNRFHHDLGKSASRLKRNSRNICKNHGGLSDAKLHSLAQSLQPGDRAQEEHLSLLNVSISWRLNWKALDSYANPLINAKEQVSKLVSTVEGQGLL